VLEFLKPKRVEIQQNPQWAQERRVELEVLLQNLDVSLADAYQKLKDFRFQHTAIQDGQICFISSDPNSRMRLEGEWRDLVLQRDQIHRSRNGVLAELSGLPKE
jgi:hypothetical protein